MTLWLTVLASGLATYLTRALPLVASTTPGEGGVARRYLDALPTALIAALAGAATLAPDGAPTGGAEPMAAVAVLAVALWRRNLLLAVGAGAAVVALLRAV